MTVEEPRQMTKAFDKIAAGLADVIADAEGDSTKGRAARWLEENRAALDASNAWVEANGLPLEDKRLF